MAALLYTGSDLPKEEKPSINASIHGAGIIFGSPKYQVKWELVEGGFLDKQPLDGEGETTPQTTPPLKAPSNGATSKNEQDGTKIGQS
ncbi:hypothetical protein RI537_13365 [Aeromonas salmonicida]|uniref:hypothetical protein n=1 Tax=Aeromonas salmonicida TaxID=645 RepID=UPI003418C4A2